MLRLDKVIKPWKESAALNDHITLYGFWNETAFLTKSGDVGMVLSVPGVDYESLDRSEQEYAVKRLEAALKAFGPGFHIYQYLFKSNRPDIPFARYDDPIVEAAIDQRRKFFEAKRDHLYRVEIFYCILLEGSRSKTGVGAAFARFFRDPAGAVGELKAQFTSDSMKTLLRILADPVFSSDDPRLTGHHAPFSHVPAISPLQTASRDIGFRSGLPRLSGTRGEGESIAADLPFAKVFRAFDFKASVQTALSNEISGYRIWHFATHGLLDEKSPDLSGLVFSLFDSGGHRVPGYLKVQDIFDLSLHTQLVVLSACNSGLGELIDGEGTVGLSYAFLHAGAKQVVSTLWSVDDETTRVLMSEFYRAMLSDGDSPSRALRKAVVTVMRKSRTVEPYYWAAYVITADSL